MPTTDPEPVVPLRELIHNGGFVFAMVVLVLLAILTACMGLGQ